METNHDRVTRSSLCDVSACGIFHRGNVRETLRLISAVMLRGCTCGSRHACVSVQFSFQSFEDRVLNDDMLDTPSPKVAYIFYRMIGREETNNEESPLILESNY